MGQLQAYVEKLDELGFQLVGIAPDAPEKLKETMTRAKSSFRLLSDTKYVAAKAFGVAFKRENKRPLPVPSIFLLSPEGRVQYVYVNPNYRERLSPDVLMAMARDVAQRFEMGQ